jgi:proline iminopeptidase
MDLAIADIERTRVALGMDRPILVGHSMHGTVVLAYALAYPDRVAGVISIGAPPDFDTTTVVASAAYWRSFASPGRKAFDDRNPLRLQPDSLKQLTPNAAFIATYVGNGARYWADSSFDASTLWAGMTVNPAVVYQLYDMAKPYHLPETPSDGRPPVFLALGRFDFVVPPTLWDGRGRAFPQLTRLIFERSGHTPQLEEATAFDRAVLEWVAQLR